MDKNSRIMRRIKEDYKLLSSEGYKVLGVFLQGSQNYGLDYAGSDIDTKAIIIPSLDDIVFNRQPVSTTRVLPSNEHIDIKDIRLMHQCFKKQNINFIEILFTPWYVLNKRYEGCYENMFVRNELIAHYNNYAAVNCMVGAMHEKYKALEHPYPTIKDKIEKFGYDPKQLHHILRYNQFLKKYLEGREYAECLDSDDKEFLVKIKDTTSGKALFSLEEARELAAKLVKEADEIKQQYMDNNPLHIITGAGETMDECLYNVIKRSLTDELRRTSII